MALFVLGDTHLSLGASKPMDVFPGWNGYVERLERNWRKLIKPEDTIVLAGDISWAMRLTDTRKDFAFLQQLPGQKLIMKGNHDYWWTTANKMNAYLKAEGFDTLHILHNNSYAVEGYAICGTRGWLFDVGEAHDEKVMNREIGRLKMSLDAAEPGLEKLVFLHYPPVYTGTSAPEIAKYKYNQLALGDIGGIPRVLDAGQCNDSYSLAVIAMKLKEVFGLDDINDLPIVYNIAWYEQKAVLVLLALAVCSHVTLSYEKNGVRMLFMLVPAWAAKRSLASCVFACLASVFAPAPEI